MSQPPNTQPRTDEVPDPSPTLPQPVTIDASPDDSSGANCNRMSVEEIKDIEKFRLGVWIAKTSVILMGIIIMSTMSVFLYLSYRTGTMPDAGVVFTLFNHLKELIVIVIDTGK